MYVERTQKDKTNESAVIVTEFTANTYRLFVNISTNKISLSSIRKCVFIFQHNTSFTPNSLILSKIYRKEIEEILDT